MHGGIHHVKVIHAEHVAPNALPVVELLPLVSQHRANDDARVLNDHLARIDVALTEQAAPVDG
jgi:hypothetical protein